MQQEHVFLLHPIFLSSIIKTICSVLPITNNFWATDPVVEPQVKQQELQTTETPQQSDKERNNSGYSLRYTLVSVFRMQWKVKRERHLREKERERHLREKETAILSLPPQTLLPGYCCLSLHTDESTYCESMESFHLLR